MRVGLVVVDDGLVDPSTLRATVLDIVLTLQTRGFDPVVVYSADEVEGRRPIGTARVVDGNSRRTALIEAARLIEGAQHVVVVDGRLVLHEQLIDEVVAAPETCVLVDHRPPNDGAGLSFVVGGDVVRDVRWSGRYDRGAPPVRESRWFQGVTSVGSRWTPALGRELRALVDGLEPGDAQVLERDLGETIATVLVRVAGEVVARPVHGAVAVAVRDGEGLEEARSRRERIDDEELRLRRAVKLRDGFFTTFFVSPYSRYLARWLARAGWSPDQVTAVSLLVGLAAAAAFALGTPVGLLAGAALLQLSFVLDCVDGQLARYSERFSSFGAWLDATADRFKEAAVYLGLAWGAFRFGDEDLWLMAVLALAIQTLRHHLDFAFNMSPTGPEPARPELSSADLRRTDTGRLTESGRRTATRLLDLAASLGRRPGLHWLKAIVILPIGERLALISLVSVVWGPRSTFVALIAWGGVAALYLTTGRVLRTWS